MALSKRELVERENAQEENKIKELEIFIDEQLRKKFELDGKVTISFNHSSGQMSERQMNIIKRIYELPEIGWKISVEITSCDIILTFE
ncbi:MAG: hypothetical protein HYT37_02445 [Candidatus Sungbacteria bacterium]|nr:hypothetical protein [Candidatus Sungbacteria bacterium]